MLPAMFLAGSGLSAVQLVCIVAAVMSLILSILMCGFFRKKTTQSVGDSAGSDNSKFIAVQTTVRKDSNSVQVAAVTGDECNTSSNNHHNSSCVSDDNNYESVTSNTAAAGQHSAPQNNTNNPVTTATVTGVLRSTNNVHSSPVLPPRNTTIISTVHVADPAAMLRVSGPASGQGGTLSMSSQAAAKPDYATINVRQGATGRQTPPTSFTSALDETYESIDQVDSGNSTLVVPRTRETSRQSLQPPMFIPLRPSLSCEIRSELSPSNILARSGRGSAAGGDNQSTGYARIGDLREGGCGGTNETDTGSGVYYAIVNKHEVVPKTSKDIPHIVAKMSRSNDSGTSAAHQPAERTSQLGASDNVRESLTRRSMMDDTGDYSSLDEVPDSTEPTVTSSRGETSFPAERGSRGYEKVDFGATNSVVDPSADGNADYEAVGDLELPATRTLPESYHATHIYEEVTEVSAEIERMQNGNHVSKTTR